MLWLTITAVCCGRLCTSTLDELSEVLGRIRYLASFAPKISIPVLAILIIYSRMPRQRFVLLCNVVSLLAIQVQCRYFCLWNEVRKVCKDT
jgi:hypothetical protein